VNFILIVARRWKSLWVPEKSVELWIYFWYIIICVYSNDVI